MALAWRSSAPSGRDNGDVIAQGAVPIRKSAATACPHVEQAERDTAGRSYETIERSEPTGRALFWWMVEHHDELKILQASEPAA